MMKKITLSILFSLVLCFSYGQWKPINPGAGGQIQDIVSDPNTVGRLILASDMEGIYESLDHGESWHAKGELHQNRAYAVAFAPNNTNKLFVGTLYSLEVSNDGGNTFTIVDETKKKSIGAIAVDPNDENVIIAGVGWRDDYDFSDTFGLTQDAKGEIFRSADGGTSWSVINFDEDAGSDRNVFSIQFDKNDSNIVYLGAGKGLFKSTDAGLTWTKINGPDGVQKNKGASLSPDGKILYAAYTTSGSKGWIYATPTSAINWQKVTDGSKETLGNYDFWYPEVDSRSVDGNHKLIIGLQNSREGLFEGTFSWDGDTLTDYSWKVVWKGTEGYDNGWDNAPPNPRFVHYTPSNWDRALWSTTNQVMFQGTPNGDTYTWHNKYSVPNLAITVSQWGQEWPTYSGRGTESTYSYDIAVHDNYVVQGQGDNGAMEGWDHGFSWSNIQHRLASPPLSDVQAVDIAVGWGTPMVVAQMTSGYGGNALEGGLYAKKLDNHSPEDKWLFLAGGWSGLPSGVLRDVAVSPAKPDRVFAHSISNGIWMMDDIGWAYNQAEQGTNAWWTRIDEGSSVTEGMYAVKKIAPHPTNADIVYMNGTGGGNEGVFKGEKVGDVWQWSKIYNGSGWDSEIVAWESNGQVFLFFSGASSEDGDGNNFIGALSLDEGVTWKTVLTKNIATGINKPDWYDAIATDFGFRNKGGAAGYGNQIIMSYYDHRMQKTYGVYKGTIDDSGDVTWKNWTGDLHFGGLTSTIIKEEGGVPYVFASTAGAGAWKRALDMDGVVLTKPNAPSDVTATAVSGSEITITWTDNADNEMGFRVERMQDGTYVTIANLDADATSYTDKDLNASTEYKYRVKAFNAAGDSPLSDVASGTTTDEVDACDAANLIGNSEFDSDLQDWIFYKNDGAGVDAEVAIVADAGLSGDKAAKVTINSALDGSKDSDIQFYYNIPNLQKGKTYIYTFLAKSTGSRTIRASVLKGAAPWTTYSSEEVTLSDTGSTYGPFEFTMGEDGTELRLDFLLSKSAEPIWLDNIVLKEKCDDGSGGTAPNAPTELTTTVISSSVINLGWMDNSEDETGFKVERRKGNGDYETIATVGENTKTYASEGLDAGTAYTFRVKAINISGESTYSNESSATTNNGNTNSCDETDWIPNGEFDSGTRDWNFYANTSSTAKGSLKASTGEGLSGDLSAKITIETAGTTDADIQFHTALPELEKDVTYVLSFMAKADAKKSIRVAVLLGEAPWSNFLEVNNIEITTEAATYGPYEFTMADQTDKGQFHFFLGKDNIDIVVDKVSIKQKCDVVSVIPNAPTALTAKVMSDNQIDLSWVDNADNEDNFILERKSSGDFETVATIDANTVFHSDTNLEAGTEYTYRISAKNDTGNSDFSNEVIATTTGDNGGGTACDNDNIVPNGEFDSGTRDWNFYNNTGGTGEAKSVSGEGLSGDLSTRITMEKAGASDSDVQYHVSLPTLEKGKTYELSFMAKADAPKDIRVAVLLGESPWSNFVQEEMTVPETATTFGPFEFTMAEETSKGQFHFFLAKDNTSIVVDNVIIQEKCEEVSGCDNPNQISNGEFDSGDRNWIFYNNTSGTGEAKIVTDAGLSGENATQLNIEKAGAGDSDVQYYQSGLPTLQKDVTYELSFMAKAAAAKTIRVAVLRGESPWNNFLQENVEVSTEAKMYGPFEFTMVEESTVSQFHFFLGNDNISLWVDAVVLKEKCPVAATVPAAPTELVATMESSSQINLAWMDNADNESGFVIERKLDGDFEEIATVDANTTSYASTGLIPETEYSYRVKAINDTGSSTYSNESSDITDSESGISYNNFNIESVGETCTDKNNGQIIIKTKKRFDYTTTIAGVDYSFDDTQVIDDLEPGTYDFCIAVAAENFEQCFSVIIVSAVPVAGKLSVVDNKLEVDMTAGTAPFDVVVNGKSAFKTSSKTFSVDVKHGDEVTINTSKSCEGVLAKKMDMLTTLTAFPNPAKDVFEIAIPTDDKEVLVQIFNLQSQVVLSQKYAVKNRRVQVNVSDKAAGVYIVQVQLENKSVTLKLIKN
jgi:hypothetical protein